MNKLLIRLEDNSKEAVRNQVLLLILQLTRSNEEMKKAVVFNEVIFTYLHRNINDIIGF